MLEGSGSIACTDSKSKFTEQFPENTRPLSIDIKMIERNAHVLILSRYLV